MFTWTALAQQPGIGTVSVRTDGRPRFVIQINVRSQHSIRATVLRLVARTIDNIPEQLQLVSGADLIGIGCCAKAVHVNIAPSNREVQCRRSW